MAYTGNIYWIYVPNFTVRYKVRPESEVSRICVIFPLLSVVIKPCDLLGAFSDTIFGR